MKRGGYWQFDWLVGKTFCEAVQGPSFNGAVMLTFQPSPPLVCINFWRLARSKRRCHQLLNKWLAKVAVAW